MKQTIQEVMTNHVVTIQSTTPFTEAIRMFKNFGLHHLPVVEKNKKLRGIFSSNDALAAYERMFNNNAQNGKQSINELIKIDDIMTKSDLITLDVQEDLRTAIDLFKSKNIHSILVLDNSKLIGILTPMDILSNI